MPGWKGLPCAPAAPRLFAVASEVPASNKAAATAIRAALVMQLLQVASSCPIDRTSGPLSNSILLSFFLRRIQSENRRLRVFRPHQLRTDRHAIVLLSCRALGSLRATARDRAAAGLRQVCRKCAQAPVPSPRAAGRRRPLALPSLQRSAAAGPVLIAGIEFVIG